MKNVIGCKFSLLPLVLAVISCSTSSGTSPSEPVEFSSKATVSFHLLSQDGSPVDVYEESGIRVSSTSGNWKAMTGYGAPAPAIVFTRLASEATIEGEVEITVGGSVFGCESLDLYSSITPIPYTITGFRNSKVVFTLAGTVPNTFGNFATVNTSHGTDGLDSLLIRLSNPATSCCSNPVGIDNIVLNR